MIREIKKHLLDDTILHVDVRMERLIIIHYLRSFDEKTVTLCERLVEISNVI